MRDAGTRRHPRKQRLCAWLDPCAGPVDEGMVDVMGRDGGADGIQISGHRIPLHPRPTIGTAATHDGTTRMQQGGVRRSRRRIVRVDLPILAMSPK
jgi:hypothetical protein